MVNQVREIYLDTGSSYLLIGRATDEPLSFLVARLPVTWRGHLYTLEEIVNRVVFMPIGDKGKS